MPVRWRPAAVALLCLAASAPCFAQPPQDSIEAVRAYLAAHPSDSDAQVRLAILLLRAGSLDEASSQIRSVLQASPDNSDALLVMSLIQLRTGDAAGAEASAAHGLAVAPTRSDLRLAHARALRNMGRPADALDEVRKVLAREPSNDEAMALYRALQVARPLNWTAAGTAEHDWFSGGQLDWQEYTATLKRQFTDGSVIGRFSDAHRFDESDQQFDVDAYPTFRKGTYAYLNAGASVHDLLYPAYRVGAELYQSLGHGFEASMGYRRLGFDGNPVNIYTPSATYYFGNSLLTLRVYITPRLPQASQSFHVTYRRYFGDGKEYVGLRVGHGASHEIRNVNDIALLGSNVIAGDMIKHLGARVDLTVSASYSRDDRLNIPQPLSETALLAGLAIRF